MVQAILGIMGSQSLLHLEALSVRLSKGSIVLIAMCSARSNCVFYLLVVSIVVLSQAILCPVVREWWALGRSRLIVGEVIWDVLVKS